VPQAGADGTGIELRVEMRMPGGNLLALPIAMELLRRVDLGQFSLDELIQAPSDTRMSETSRRAIPQAMTIDGLLERMIAGGEEWAAGVLLDLVGRGEINETMSRLTLTATHVARRCSTPPADAAYAGGETSARDMLALLGRVRGWGLPGAARLRVLLAEQQAFGVLRDALPDEAELEHLPAVGLALAHEVGILRGPAGACAYAILIAEPAMPADAQASVCRVVRALWDAWCAC
jgi:hypothetical protein